MTIRAIETAYKGYRFRSRLEARWAVFFDALGIEWQYEPEGFELEAGRYLPDFLIRCDINGVSCLNFVEIKGAPPTELDLILADQLAKALDCCVQLFQGDPRDAVARRFFPQIAPACAESCSINLLGFFAWAWTGFDREPSSAEIARAADAARSARFEHGETGALAR